MYSIVVHAGTPYSTSDVLHAATPRTTRSGVVYAATHRDADDVSRSRGPVLCCG